MTGPDTPDLENIAYGVVYIFRHLTGGTVHTLDAAEVVVGVGNICESWGG